MISFRKVKILFGIWSVCTIIFCTSMVYSYYCFYNGCSGHLARAANASTVELACSELSVATTYLERYNMIKGSSHVLFPTPDTDIEYWYNNLKESEKELMKIIPTTSQLERTNVLMKLRETLVEHGDRGSESIVQPVNIAYVPMQMVVFLATVMIVLSGVYLSVVCFIRIPKHY